MTTKKLLLNGWIYCLSNPSIPNLYKIGMTKKTPESRAKELYKTGLPEPFVIEFAKNVNEPMKKEKSIHKLLKNERHNSSREFFSSDLSKIKNIFSLCEGVDWEPINDSRNDEKELEEDMQRLLQRGVMLFGKNQVNEAKPLFEEVFRIAHDLGNFEMEGRALGNLASVFEAIGEHHHAVELYTQCIAILRKFGDSGKEARILYNISHSYLSLERYDKAIDYLNQSLALTDDTQTRQEVEQQLTVVRNSIIDNLKNKKKIEKKKRREKREYCFDNGQRIRHKLVRQSNCWIGKWNSNNKCIEYNNNDYKSLTSFAQAHSNFYTESKKASINGWTSCECEIIGVTGKRSWIKCNIYKNDPKWTVIKIK